MENKTRGAPNKDIVKAYYENNDVTLKELAEKFGIKYDRIRNWKCRDKKKGIEWIPFKSDTVDTVVTNDTLDTPKKNVTVSQNRKQLITKAKSMVISGKSLKQASDETAIPKSTLEEYSSKEKWLESRKAYNNYIYKELISQLGEQHLKDRKNAVTMSRVIGLKAFNDMQNNELDSDKARMYKEVAAIVEKTIMVAGKMLGIKDIDKIDFGELDETIDDDDNDDFIIKVVD